jgi:alpha-tubulin suppressor-like RCC1 family protein
MGSAISLIAVRKAVLKAIPLRGLVGLLTALAMLALAGPALATSSGVASWGGNENGQLGNATETSSDVPVAVSGLNGVTAVGAGYDESQALLSNGTVVAWGENHRGQLGNGTTNGSDVPVAVCAVGEKAPCAEHLSGVTAIAGGFGHTLALLENGTVVAWGENSSGQLGDGTETNSYVPVAVGGLSGVKAIAAGGDDSLAILESGTVMAWGDNSEGHLGDGESWPGQDNSDLPVAVCAMGETAPCAQHLSGVTGVATGYMSSVALLGNGTVVAWGSNAGGDLGVGIEKSEYNSDAPVAVCAADETAPCSRDLGGVKAVASGAFQNFAILGSGTAMAWGGDTPGDVPVAVSGLSDVTAITGGDGHSVALLGDGTVMTWGNGESGALGDGTTNSSTVPVAVSGLSGVTAIAAGTNHDLAMGPPLAAVADVEPRGGPPSGGISVTITGTGFSEATAVKFGSSNAQSFKVESPTSISAVSPAGTGIVDITVATPGGMSAPSPADRFTYGVAVAKVEPDEGPLAGGTPVTLTGANFTGATAVKFGSASATSFKVNSESSITAVSPPGTGTVDVTVSTPEGASQASAADKFTFSNVPTVTSLSPGSGEESGGTAVTITGTNFTGTTAVKFGSASAESFKVQSPTSIVAVSPAGEGSADIAVTTPEGTSAIGPGDKFRYDGESTCTPHENEYPTITSVQPNNGPQAGGTSVTIKGERFFVTGPCPPELNLIIDYNVRKVMFGSKEALSFKETASNEIVAVAPPGTGTVNVTVETFTSSPTSPADQYSYGGPVIERLSASHITQDDATAEVQINPEGLETTYEVFMPEDPCNVPMECILVHLPLAQGSIPATATPESFSIDLASEHAQLEAGEEYGFAILASNASGTTEMHYRFKTASKTSVAPMIESESVSEVSERDATLEAQINTQGSYTGYWFQIDTNSSYDFTQANCPFEFPGDAECDSIRVGEPLPAGLVEPQPQYIPAGSGEQSVSLDLASIGATLQPGTTYHYRVITANGGTPTVQGPDQTFTTTSSRARPLGGKEKPPTTSGSGQSGASSTPGSGSSSPATPLVSPVVKTGKPEVLTKAQKLAKALKQCRKEPKRERTSCEKQAERKYAGPKTKGTQASGKRTARGM